jgi:hypothetical protein
MLPRVAKPEGLTRIISEKLHRNGRLELHGIDTSPILPKMHPLKTAKENSDAARQCSLTNCFLPSL